MEDYIEFYQALAYKTSLRAFWVTGDADEQGSYVAVLLLASLCKLVTWKT